MYRNRVYTTQEKNSIRSLTPLSYTSSNYNLTPSALETEYPSLTKSKNHPCPLSITQENCPSGRLPNIYDNFYPTLASLENDLKALDSSFEFSQIDDSISVAISCVKEALQFLISKSFSLKRSLANRNNSVSSEMCTSCVKMKKLMEEAKFSIEREKESLENTEKHLKHFDSLLAIKENRLHEQELAYENEKNMLDMHKNELNREKTVIEKEKDALKSKSASINREKEMVTQQMEQLEIKYKNVKKIIRQYENQKSSLENTIRLEIAKTIESREANLKQKEMSLAKQAEDFKLKAKSYEKTLKEKMQQVQGLESTYKDKMASIETKEKELDGMISSAKVEEIKQSEEQKHKIWNLEKTLQEKTQKAQMIEEMYKEKYKIIENKEKQLDNMIGAVKAEEAKQNEDQKNKKKLHDKSLHEKMEQMQLLEERYKEKLALIESKEKQLENIISAVRAEEDKLEERWKCVQSVEGKLESLNRKEEELAEIENQLKKEREEIDINTLLIKQLNDDLEKQKKNQAAEKRKLTELANELKIKQLEINGTMIVKHDPEKSFKEGTGSMPILLTDLSSFFDKDLGSL